MHIFSQLWHFRVVEILSNLTFEGYLDSTTPVLSIGVSLFLSHRFCLEHMRATQLTNDFLVSLEADSMVNIKIESNMKIKRQNEDFIL